MKKPKSYEVVLQGVKPMSRADARDWKWMLDTDPQRLRVTVRERAPRRARRRSK